MPVAGEHVRLHRGAERHHLVGIQIVERVAPEELADGALDLRHARRAADHHHALDLVHRQAGIAQRLAYRAERLVHQRLGDAAEGLGVERDIDQLARGELCRDVSFRMKRQELLRLAGLDQQQAHVPGRERRELRLLDAPAEHALVEVVAAEHRVAARRDDLEHAARELENRQVEGAAAEVVDRVDAFGGILQAVGDGRGGRLVEQAQHVEAGQPRGVLGSLALGIVEIGRNGYDGAAQAALQGQLRTLAQHFQDLGGDFDRALDARRGANLQHAGSIDEVVGRVLDVRDVLDAAAHVALHRDDGVFRIVGLPGLRRVAHLGAPVGQETHDRGQQRPSVRVGEHGRGAAAHGRYQRVGRAQVDAHCEAVLVRRRRSARLGDLQQCHYSSAS